MEFDDGFPKAKIRLAQVWMDLHSAEFMENWRLIGSDRKFFKISPLEVKRKGGAAMLSCAKAISATPLDDYKVAVVFNNGQRGIFDCKYLLDYAIRAPLADYSLFNQVRVEHGTLCWPNDIDVAPEAVWEGSKKQYASELLAV